MWLNHHHQLRWLNTYWALDIIQDIKSSTNYVFPTKDTALNELRWIHWCRTSINSNYFVSFVLPHRSLNFPFPKVGVNSVVCSMHFSVLHIFYSFIALSFCMYIFMSYICWTFPKISFIRYTLITGQVKYIHTLINEY